MHTFGKNVFPTLNQIIDVLVLTSTGTLSETSEWRMFNKRKVIAKFCHIYNPVFKEFSLSSRKCAFKAPGVANREENSIKPFLAFLYSSIMFHPVLITCHYSGIRTFAYMQQHLKTQSHPGLYCYFSRISPFLANNKGRLAALSDEASAADAHNYNSHNVSVLQN